jgi:hypothetical protein
VILLPLPGASARDGRAWFARTPAPLGLRRDDDVEPPGAVFLEVADPAATLMIHVPDALPGAACYDALTTDTQARKVVEWECFVDRFLAAAIVEPAMSEAQVQEVLADDRDALATALLRLWNWIPEHRGATCPAPVELGGETFCRHMPNLPSAPFQEVLRFLASRLRMAPSEILTRFSFSEVNLNYHILRGQPKKAAAQAFDDDRPDLAAIGLDGAEDVDG